jgi:hypothetical protein
MLFPVFQVQTVNAQTFNHRVKLAKKLASFALTVQIKTTEGDWNRLQCTQ